MLSRFSKLILFTSSYLPLFVIIVIYNFGNCPVRIGACIFMMLCIFFVGLMLSQQKKYNKDRYELVAIKNLTTETVTNYLVIYIFPFITLDFSNAKSLFVFIFLFSLTAFIYTKHDILYINPVLNLLFGYNIYSVETRTKQGTVNTYILLSKKKRVELKRIEEIEVNSLASSVLVEIE